MGLFPFVVQRERRDLVDSKRVAAVMAGAGNEAKVFRYRQSAVSKLGPWEGHWGGSRRC